jgi:hypothetical protein
MDKAAQGGTLSPLWQAIIALVLLIIVFLAVYTATKNLLPT